MRLSRKVLETGTIEFAAWQLDGGVTDDADLE
ncbi:hypothetical protein IWQ48_004394 [Labrenzia sp. EL_13]|nr:hypothetical protein [Labrenzia sp. EL_195]MBG6203237.1 hypothetical protein [Labrenzia sp. EL_13]